MKITRIPPALVTCIAIAAALASVYFFATSAGLQFAAKAGLALLGAALAIMAYLRWRHGARQANLIAAALVMMGVATVIGLALAEFAVRVIYRDVSSTGDNTSYFAARDGSPDRTARNRLGFREREVSDTAATGTYRIAVIGDSFTFGQGISQADRFSNRVAAALNKKGKSYEVLNFGVPGAETVDHLNILEQTVLGLEPDFVLLQWYINDVEGPDKSGRPQYWRLVPSDFLSDFFHRHSALYYLINRQWIQLQVSLGFTPTYEHYLNDRFGDETSPASRQANEALDHFVEIVRSHDIGLGIIAFPRLVDPAPGAGPNPGNMLIDRVMSTCQRHRLICIDMREVIGRAGGAAGLRVNAFDNHPNAAANALAAEAIVEVFEPLWGLPNAP